MKNKKIILFLLMILGIACIIGIFWVFLVSQREKSNIKAPFKILVDKVGIVQEEIPEEMSSGNDLTATRLEIQVSIQNITEEDFDDVEYTLQLNDEVKPYIATGILQFHQEAMNVVSKAKSSKLKEQGIELLEGNPVIWGFTHKWAMLLTTEEDLETYYGYSKDGIKEALKTMTVHIYWDGGTQTEILPLILEN